LLKIQFNCFHVLQAMISDLVPQDFKHSNRIVGSDGRGVTALCNNPDVHATDEVVLRETG
jgi:hypothetical protein